MLVVAGVAAGCGVSGAAPEAGRIRPAETSVPKGTSDPRARGAVAAYEAFSRTTIEALKKPLADSRGYPDAADFTRFSFDPVESEFEATMKLLSQANGQFRGTPPQSHLTVTSIDQDASPWPTVTLSDCKTGQDAWQAFSVGSNKRLPGLEPSIPSPYGATITVIYNQQRWGVNTITLDSSRTCP